MSTPQTLARRVLAGERRALAKAISLLEGCTAAQRRDSALLLTELAPHAGKAVRLAVSGPPGVGKSTFIEAFGLRLLASGHRVAVLAIDPSSPLSGGSILGDRLRMEQLSADERVFIRPSPAGTSLGGAARHTREAILACEAAGYDYVIVETVGVGQSETLAAGMVDCFLYLHLPGAGDDIQGIKRGILELADLVAVTKADGTLLPEARLAEGHLSQALMLARSGSWVPPVRLISTVEGTGLPELEASLRQFLAHQRQSGDFAAKRRAQAGQWFRSEVAAKLQEALNERPQVAALMGELELAVCDGRAAATAAAQVVLDKIFGVAGSFRAPL